MRMTCSLIDLLGQPGQLNDLRHQAVVCRCVFVTLARLLQACRCRLALLRYHSLQASPQASLSARTVWQVAPSCPSAAVDARGICCLSGLTDAAGGCCAVGAVLDGAGLLLQLRVRAVVPGNLFISMKRADIRGLVVEFT